MELLDFKTNWDVIFTAKVYKFLYASIFVQELCHWDHNSKMQVDYKSKYIHS